MKYTYRTQGTCSQAIEFEIEDGIVKNVQFYGGCNGNTQGIATLVEGMSSPNWKASAADSKAPLAQTNWLKPLRKFAVDSLQLTVRSVELLRSCHPCGGLWEAWDL